MLDADGPTGVIASIDFAWDPAFFFRRSDGRDFGVVLLPAGSVTGIEPVILPAAGALDALRQGAALKRIDAESVGYGNTATFNQPGGVQFGFDGLRRRVDTQLKGSPGRTRSTTRTRTQPAVAAPVSVIPGLRSSSRERATSCQ